MFSFTNRLRFQQLAKTPHACLSSLRLSLSNQIYLCKKFVWTIELVATCLQTETAATSNIRFSDYFYIVGQQKKKSKIRPICLHDVRKNKDLLWQSNWKWSFRPSSKHVSLTEFLRSVCRVQVNNNTRCWIHSSVLGISPCGVNV